MAQLDDAICSNCHALNPVTVAFCSTCGSKINIASKLPPPVDKMAPAIKAAQVIGVAVILFVVVSLIIWIANGGLYKSNVSESDIPAVPKIGTERLLNAHELSIVYVGTSKEALMEFVKTVQAKDEIGLRQLVLSRRLFAVEKNTRALILENDDPFLKVRILEGSHITEAGWIDLTWVK
jgi:hypothetical protein